MSVLFISHSSRDGELAIEVKQRLEDAGHRSLFLDLDPEKGITAGSSWERTLYTKLRASRAVLVICTQNYVASQWCFAELALARMEGKSIFALQCDPWRPSSPLPALLSGEQVIDLRSDFDEGFARLWRGLDSKGITPADHRSWSPGEPPYPGLLAYREQDAPVFFGREEETRKTVELLARLQRQGHPRLLLLLGASGSGKSSLARAGVLPRLQRDPGHWLVLEPFRPGRDPHQRLAQSLAQAFAELGATWSVEQIVDRLRPPPSASAAKASRSDAPVLDLDSVARRRLLRALNDFDLDPQTTPAKLRKAVQDLRHSLTEHPPSASQRPPRQDLDPATHATPAAWLDHLLNELQLATGLGDRTILLTLDQLEELLDEDGEQDQASSTDEFLSLLVQVLGQHENLLILATLRSDFLPPLQQHRLLNTLDFESWSLSPMAPANMRQVIEEPARLAGLQLEPGLSDRLLADTGTADALPLLAFTLRLLWDRYRENGALTLRDYRELGGLQGAVAQAAEEAFAGASQLGAEQELRPAFLAMARPAAGAAVWTRRPLRLSDVKEPERVLPMLRHFELRRLLVTDDEGTFEIAHEALFRTWQRLREWLKQNAEAMQLLTEISIDSQRWLEAEVGQRASYLLRGWRLQRALDLVDSGDLLVRESESQLLQASAAQEREERRNRDRRRQRTALALVFIAILMSVLAASAWRGRVRAEEQLSEAIAISARSGTFRHDRALLMAVEATQHPSFESRTSLFQLLQTKPRLEAFLHGHGELVWSLEFTTDGTLASGSGDRTMRLWDIRQRAEVGRWPASHQVVGLGFDRSGRPLGTTSGPGELLIWGEKEHGAAQGETAAYQGVFTGAFNHDGSLRAVGTTSGRVCIEARDSRPVCAEQAHEGFVTQVAFGPQGMVISTGRDGVARAWRSDGQRLVPGWQAAGQRAFTAVAASGHQQLSDAFFVVGDAAGELARIDATTGRLSSWPSGHDDAIAAIALGPLGNRPRLLATGSVDGTLRVWHFDPQHLDPHLDPSGLPELAFEVDSIRQGVYSLAIDPTGTTLASGSRDGLIRLWLLAAQPPRIYSLGDQAEETRGFAFHPSGDLAISGDLAGVARIWSLTDQPHPEPTLELVVGGEVNSIAINARQEIAVAGSGLETRVLMWDLTEASVSWSSNEEGWITSLELDDQGRVAYLNSHQLSTSQPRQPPRASQTLPPELERPRTLAIDATGAQGATGHDDGSVNLWRIDPDGNWSAPKRLRDSSSASVGRVLALAFSPDGKYLAIGGKSFEIQLWEIAGGRLLEVLAGHEGAIRDLQFNPAGNRLASASDDSSLNLWKIPSGERLYALLGHQGIVYRAGFTANGKELLSGSDDRTIRRWPIHQFEPLEAAQQAACRIANRQLTGAEQRDYLHSVPNALQRLLPWRKPVCEP